MRLIFNEKLLKSVICGSVNNAWIREQCFYALFTEDLVNNCGLEKKKKKEEEGERRKKKRRRANTQSKHILIDNTCKLKNVVKICVMKFRSCLVEHISNMSSVFKQH